jgi:hypothetical protein
MHDDKCERPKHWTVTATPHCRCEVRALAAQWAGEVEQVAHWKVRAEAAEEKLAQAEQVVAEAVVAGLRSLDRATAAESRLAALRPLVRAAVAWDECHQSRIMTSALESQIDKLPDDLIAWAKGGE